MSIFGPGDRYKYLAVDTEGRVHELEAHECLSSGDTIDAERPNYLLVALLLTGATALAMLMIIG